MDDQVPKMTGRESDPSSHDVQLELEALGGERVENEALQRAIDKVRAQAGGLSSSVGNAAYSKTTHSKTSHSKGVPGCGLW